MKAGIIAAGLGERLAGGGVCTPKPLVQVGGETLISRAIRAAAAAGATSVACIVNDLHPAVARYLRSISWPVPLELVVKTTPSSMESLFFLAPFLQREPFLLLTVDTVFEVPALQKFLARVSALPQAQGVLALTRWIDDEKPLWAEVDRNHKILALGEDARGSRYITAGYYCFKPDVFEMVDFARKRKLNALRQFLGFLLEKGYFLYGLQVPKAIDVDHPRDIQKAEIFLARAGRRRNR